MFLFKVLAAILLLSLHQTECSVLPAHIAAPAVIAPPVVRYRLVAPQNIRPFAAQVSTFTKGLNIYAAPYAAGVLSAPAILPHAAFPAPAPVLPAAAPVYPSVYPAGVPVAPAAVPVGPAPVVGPSPLLPAPFARSVHAVAPGVAPAYPALGLPPAHLLG